LICAATLVAIPVDAKKHVRRHAPPAASQMVYGGSAEPRHVAGDPVRSGNMCWKNAFGYTTRGQHGYWATCRSLCAAYGASKFCR
jgi:hypothetical protein